MKVTIVLLLLFQSWILTSQQYLTSTPEPSYTSLNNARCITDSEDYLHVVYTEGDQHEEKVMYRRGFAGYFYQDEIVLSDDGGYPSIAASNGTLHVVYTTLPFSWGELYYVRSKNDGSTWEDPVYLTFTSGVCYPSIAAYGQTIHVVWKDSQFDYPRIYYKRSDDGGDTWTDDVLLSDGDYTALNPCIAVHEDEVHVAWSGDSGIEYLHSTDGGQHWSLPVPLSDHPLVSPPSMTVSESVVVVCWTDTLPQHAEIVLRRSIDSGNTWEDEARLFVDDYNTSNPNIDSDGNIFALVWNVMVNGNWVAASSFSGDQGRTWSPASGQFEFTTFAFHPFVTVHDEMVHMICWDKADDQEVAYQYAITDFPFIGNNELDWGFSIGSNGQDYPNKMIKDDAGNLYITGKFSGTVDFDPGPSVTMVNAVKQLDIFIAKYSSSGQLIWVKSIGGLNHDGGSDIGIDAEGNIYVAGEFGGIVDFDPGSSTFNLDATTFANVFVLKLNHAGDFVWARNVGYGGGHNTTILTMHPLGHVIVGGTFGNSGDFDPSSAVTTLTSKGNADIFILSLDLDGNFDWARSFGGVDREAINDIEIDGENNILITGEYVDTVDFDPGPGLQMAVPFGGRDLYLLKLNEQGNFERVFTTGSTGYDSGQTIEMDHDGNILFFGEYSKTMDIDPGPGVVEIKFWDAFLSKLDVNWNLLWVKTFSGEFGYQAPIRLDSLQNIYMLVNSTYIAGDPEKPNQWLYGGDKEDVFLLKLTPEGDFVWINQFNGDGYSYGKDLVIEGYDLYITGHFDSSLDLDPAASIELIQSEGSQTDMFIMKIVQCGPVYHTINVTRCEAYDVPNSDEVWTVSGVYHRQLISGNGCDSLLTVNLTILQPSFGSESVTACNEFISPAGSTWNASGVYQETLTNVLGCDSIVTYDLTILSSSSLDIDVEACNEFTSPDGDTTLTSSGTFQEAFTNAAGCDSIVTYNVLINHDAIHEYAVSACDLYTTPDGTNTWTQSGTYTYIIPASSGCDSIITVDATITALDLTVKELGQSLKSQQENATYQWFDCNGGLPVAGATDQEFYPVISGNYGVIVEAAGCVDTSACYTVILVGTQEQGLNNVVKIFPNPAKDHVLIDIGKQCKEIEIQVMDINGRMIVAHQSFEKREVQMELNLVPGIYAFHIKADGVKAIINVVVE